MAVTTPLFYAFALENVFCPLIKLFYFSFLLMTCSENQPTNVILLTQMNMNICYSYLF